MHILNEGRSAFLEFLRNLTPQALILSIAIIAGMKLDFTRFNLSNTGPTLIFLSLILIWAMAVWSNSSIFLEKSLVAAKPVNRASRLFARQNLRGIPLMRANLVYSWRNQRVLFLELIVLMIILEFGLVVVGISAIYSASSILSVT